METNWLIIILVILIAIVLIAFFNSRNQKDKKEFIRELIRDDELSIQKEQDTEVDTADP
jgi:uncharacterized membrane protein